jgi:PKD repeat protein
MKRHFKAVALVSLILAGVAVAKADSYGDLIVGFTTLSGNDIIYDIGSLASLTTNETWNAGTLGISAGSSSSYQWGVIGSADIGDLPPDADNSVALVFSTLGTGTPGRLNGESAFNSIDSSISSLVNTLPGGINGFQSGWGALVADSNPNSWGTQTVDGALSTDYHIAYLNPNVTGQASAYLYTVTANNSAPVLAGAFRLSTSGTLTFMPAPTAGFTGTPTSGTAPLEVVFTDASSGSISNWLWNFGDGHSITNSTSSNVTNTYATAGSYTVTLTVTGPGGPNSQIRSGYIVVSPAAPLVINSARLSSGNFVLSGTGGSTGAPYRILCSTNLAQPYTNWTTVASSTFLSGGSFSYTTGPTNAAGLFRVVTP